MKKIQRTCELCQSESHAPHRFRTSLPSGYCVFNRLVALELIRIDQRTVVHVVERDMWFRTASFFHRESPGAIVEAFLIILGFTLRWVSLCHCYSSRTNVPKFKVEFFTKCSRYQVTSIWSWKSQYTGIRWTVSCVPAPNVHQGSCWLSNSFGSSFFETIFWTSEWHCGTIWNSPKFASILFYASNSNTIKLDTCTIRPHEIHEEDSRLNESNSLQSKIGNGLSTKCSACYIHWFNNWRWRTCVPS